MSVKEKIIQEIKNRNYKIKQELAIGEYGFFIDDVQKHNAAIQNTNYSLTFYQRVSEFMQRYIAGIKIPMNASDKVISNRLNKLFEKINKEVNK